MSLKIRLWVYLGALHAGLAAVLFWHRASLGWWLVPLEVAILLSLFAGVRLVRLALEPLAFARTFSEVIRSGEYGSRYARVGRPELDAIVATYNEMLSNLQRERLRLGEQRGFLERFLQITPVGIVILDFDGCVSLANSRAPVLLGGEALEGRHLDEFDSPLARALDTLAVDETRMIVDAAGRRLRGRRSEFHDRGFPRSYVLIEELTVELNRSERATYEKLIRMISHEVTNTVAATNSLLGSCLKYAVEIDAEHRTDYETALDVVITRNRSLNEFTKRFADIVKLPEPDRQDVKVGELLDVMRTMFRAELEQRDITLDLTVDADLPLVSMDREQMEQVLINVIKNAVEAIERSGHIELRAERLSGHVRIAVLDDGAGLSAESRANLFTPFYTSKRYGQGLGLTLVKEILSQHGFGFSLESGGGRTRFEITMAG